MSTIKYTNDFGDEVTIDQANQLPRYHQVIIDGDNNKYVKTFVSGSLTGITYFVPTFNDINAVLQNDPNASFEIKSIINNYKIGDKVSYRDRILVYKSKVVNDASGNSICYAKYDPETCAPKYILTEKSYFDENGNEIYSFTYNNDGSCFSIDRVQYREQGSEFMVTDIGRDPEIDFTWAGFEYYQHAEPFVPIDSSTPPVQASTLERK